MNASDVMVRAVVTARPDATVRDAAQVMLDHGVSGLPVLDETGSLVGIISEGDLIRRAEIGTQGYRSWWMELLSSRDELARDYTKAHALKVADVMTRNVVTADVDTPLVDLATLLEKHGIKRVPIVRDGKVVGIVSRANLIRALASAPVHLPVETDDVTLQERTIEHIKAVPGGMPWLLSVFVKDGVAELWGPVHSNDQRTALRVAAETTPGIRDVTDRMYKMPTASD